MSKKSTIKKPDKTDIRAGITKVDWAAIDRLTDEEIAAQVAANPDAAPLLDDEAMKRARVVYPPATLDVRAIRTGLGLKRPAFADRYGFSLRTVEKWEQGVRQPEGAARTLLMVIKEHPNIVRDVLVDNQPGDRQTIPGQGT